MKEGFVLFFKKKLHLHFRQAKAWKRALCRKMGQRGVLMPISLTGSVKRRNKLASLEATLVRNYDRVTDLLTGVMYRATSVAKKIPEFYEIVS